MTKRSPYAYLEVSKMKRGDRIKYRRKVGEVLWVDGYSSDHKMFSFAVRWADGRVSLGHMSPEKKFRCSRA